MDDRLQDLIDELRSRLADASIREIELLRIAFDDACKDRAFAIICGESPPSIEAVNRWFSNSADTEFSDQEKILIVPVVRSICDKLEATLHFQPEGSEASEPCVLGCDKLRGSSTWCFIVRSNSGTMKRLASTIKFPPLRLRAN